MSFSKNFAKYAGTLFYHDNLKSWPGPSERVPELRNLEGKYKTPASCNWGSVSPLVQLLLATNGMGPENLISGKTHKGEKLGKWLLKSHVPETMISEAFNKVVPECEVELTCRFNDILRLSTSKHYVSCLSDTDFNRLQRLYYLWDKYMGLIVIRDSKGDFVYRRVISLSTLGKHGVGGRVLRVNKKYGNGPSFNALKEAFKGIDLFFCDSRYPGSEYRPRTRVYRPEEVPSFMRHYHKWDDAVLSDNCDLDEYLVSSRLDL